jgi:hypothetical protein
LGMGSRDMLDRERHNGGPFARRVMVALNSGHTLMECAGDPANGVVALNYGNHAAERLNRPRVVERNGEAQHVVGLTVACLARTTFQRFATTSSQIGAKGTCSEMRRSLGD